MSTLKKIAWTVGIAAGAALTIGAISTKSVKKAKSFITSKSKKSVDDNDKYGSDHENIYV